MLNSNNTGAAHIACPATISPVPASNPPAGGPQSSRRFGGQRWKPVRCRTSPPARDTWYAEGGQVFDTLYLLTTKMNSAWAVNTSAGIILIDTLYGDAAQDEIVNGLKKVGLDPANIKYIVVSHAHGDHNGSVKVVQDTYNPRIIMSPKDWELSAREANPPHRDIDATDGRKDPRGYHHHNLHNPGHTAGTLSCTGSGEGSRRAAPSNGVGWDGPERQYIQENAAVLHFECGPLPGYRRGRAPRRSSASTQVAFSGRNRQALTARCRFSAPRKRNREI